MVLSPRDLRVKSVQELEVQLKESRKNLKEKSKEVLNQKEKNIKIPRGIRKDIARVLNIIKEKQILENSKEEQAA